MIVRVNDRGPFVDGRVIDLTLAAAEAVGMREAGTSVYGSPPSDRPAHGETVISAPSWESDLFRRGRSLEGESHRAERWPDGHCKGIRFHNGTGWASDTRCRAYMTRGDRARASGPAPGTSESTEPEVA